MTKEFLWITRTEENLEFYSFTPIVLSPSGTLILKEVRACIKSQK